VYANALLVFGVSNLATSIFLFYLKVDTWLTTPSVLEALHVRTNESAPWESCNYDVNADFSSDWMVGYQGYVADLLQGGIRTLVYAGDVDFVCNW